MAAACLLCGSSRRPAFAQYRRKRRYLRIRRAVSVEDKGKRISILPGESFRLTCDTDYPRPWAASLSNWKSPRSAMPPRSLSRALSAGSPT